MRKWMVMVLALVIGAWSTSAQAGTIHFDNQVLDGGSVSYDGAGGVLVGTDILIDTITGTGVPTPGVLDCVGCVLNFTSGANTGEGPAVWTFAAGGTFTITGSAFDGATLVASGTLLSGHFGPGTTVTGIGSTLFVIGAGPDEKNPDLLAFFGVSAATEFTFANTEISAPSAVIGADGSFSGDISEADVVNTSSVPDGGSTMALLGLALVGLGAARRKFQI
jgi:protein with PEP-CTERM/exosortase system signal